jgi:two-component sensor histidine kinase
MGRKRLRQAGLILAFWAVETVYAAVQLRYRTALLPKPYSWASCFHTELVWTSIGLILTPLVLWLAARFPIERRNLARNISIHLAGAALFASAIKVYWDAFGSSKRPEYLAGEFSVSRLLYSISMGFDAGFAIYWGIVLTVLAADYYRRYQSSLVESAQLQTQLVQSQLQTLRMQLDPHFLFNTLHSISELVHEDPEGAEEMIARLSELLRRSIESSGAQEVPLRDELDFLNLYLEIEKTRFDDRLRVDIQVDPGAAAALVPNLILQPLVENAIRHGISRRLAGGRIEIAARRRGERLELSVSDDGPGFRQDRPLKEGVGLNATRGRLERLYGSEQTIEFADTGRGVRVRILMPYRQDPGPAAHLATNEERSAVNAGD